MQNRGQQNSRNVHTRTPAKMLEKCFAQRKAEPQQVLSLSHCETAARKIAETLPLEPTKKKQKDGKPAGNQAKPKKKVFGWSACEKAEPQQVSCLSHAKP